MESNRFSAPCVLPPIISWSVDAVSQIKLNWKYITTVIFEQSNSWVVVRSQRSRSEKSCLQMKAGRLYGL